MKKLWNPTAKDELDEPSQVLHDEMENLFGKEIADACQDYTDNGEPYPKKLIAVMYAISKGQLSKDDFDARGMDAYNELIKQKKSDYHVAKKYGKRGDSIANAHLDRVMDDEDEPLAKKEPSVIHTGGTGKIDIENGLLQKGILFKLLPTYSELAVYLYLNATKIAKPPKDDTMEVYENFLKHGKIVSTAKVKKIAEMTGLHKDTVKEVIKNLEAKGFIKRVPLLKSGQLGKMNRKATILANILDNGKIVLLLETAGL